MRFLFAMIFCLPLPSRAADFQSGEFVIEREIELTFSPEEAFLIVEPEGQRPIRSVAALVENGAASGKKHWLVGGRVQIPMGVRKVDCAVVVIGPRGARAFVAPEEIVLDDSTMYGRSVSNLREEVLRTKRTLNEEREVLAAKSGELERLERDLEGVTGIGKLASSRDRLEEVNTNLNELSEHEASLKTFMQSVESGPEPRFFRRREAQLTQQLTQLAEIAHTVESKEGDRKDLAGVDFRRKLELIRSTQFEDEALLARELAGLKARYEALYGASIGGADSEAEFESESGRNVEQNQEIEMEYLER